jgi:chlorobactene glucosyltransferase
MVTLGVLAGISVLLGLIAWRARAFFAALESVGYAPPNGETGRVSVVIPARNEAENIGRCLRSVLAQPQPDLQVVVVDDNSTDATPAIVAEVARTDRRVELVRGASLPEGWTGKNFALAQAASHAHGDWLLFMDADTWLEPGAIQAAVAHAEERRLGLLSLVPAQQLAGFWERVVQPMVLLVIALLLPMRAIGDRRRPDAAYANGQFLLVRRAVYEKVGGHESLRGAVVEDSALARAVKAAGFGVQLADGRALVHIRMYRNLRELWEGWSKNSFLSAGGRLRNIGLVVAAIAAVTIVPFALLLLGLVELTSGWGAGSGTALTTGIAGLQATLVWYLAWRADRELDVPGAYALTVPLGAALFSALLCYSAYRVVSGRGVSWKGRVYLRDSGAPTEG